MPAAAMRRCRREWLPMPRLDPRLPDMRRLARGEGGDPGPNSGSARLSRPFRVAGSRANTTPGTLGVWGSLGCCNCCVLSVSWSLFPGWRRRREGMVFLPACRGGCSVRFRGPQPPALAGAPSRGRSGQRVIPLGIARCEHGDLGLPRDGLLGRRCVREFRARLLRSPRVPLSPGDVEGVQGGACRGVRRCGERVQ
jgi:hypothetical protein